MTTTAFPAPATRRPAARIDLATGLLRLVVGGVFIAHGAQKLFVFGLGGVTAGMEQAGVPLAALAAPLVAFAELLGGLALVLGFLTRIAGAGLALVMLGAMFFVHLPNGFFAPDGVEFTLTLFAANVALALAGPGRYSIDGTLRAAKEG